MSLEMVVNEGLMMVIGPKFLVRGVKDTDISVGEMERQDGQLTIWKSGGKRIWREQLVYVLMG